MINYFDIIIRLLDPLTCELLNTSVGFLHFWHMVYEHVHVRGYTFTIIPFKVLTQTSKVCDPFQGQGKKALNI